MEPSKSGDSSQSQGCTRMFTAVLLGESRRPLTRAKKETHTHDQKHTEPSKCHARTHARTHAHTHTRCHGDDAEFRSEVVAVCREGRVAREMLALGLLIFSKLW